MTSRIFSAAAYSSGEPGVEASRSQSNCPTCCRWAACFCALVLLNITHYRDVWAAHFIEGDCRATIGPRTRHYPFPGLEALHSFAERCQPEDATLGRFEQSVRAWAGAASTST